MKNRWANLILKNINWVIAWIMMAIDNIIQFDLFVYPLVLSSKKKNMLAYVRSICNDPPTFLAHILDKSIPKLGGMSATTMSITTLFMGSYDKETTKYFINPKHLNFLESKE